MFGVFFHLLLALLYYWFPLLLSIKALDSDRNALRFLLTYWLCYCLVAHTQGFLQSHVPGLQWALEPLAASIKVWLFYGHGCLVTAHYLLPLAMQRTFGCTTFGELENNVIEPSLSTFVFKNPLLQVPFRVFGGVLLPMLPIREMLHYNAQALRSQKKGNLALQLGVDHFCYMDLKSELHARYQELRQMAGSWAPQTAKKTRSRHDTLRAVSHGAGHGSRKATPRDFKRFDLDDWSPRAVSGASFATARGSRVSSAEAPYPVNFDRRVFDYVEVNGE